jgi:phosphatidate cytidylyltransferase
MKQIIQRIITGSILAAGLTIIYTWLPPLFLSSIFALLLMVILLYEWPQFNSWLITPLYPIMPFISLIALNQGSSRFLLLLLFILVSTYDTGSYAAGKLFGKHPLMLSISPGKTWEGCLGGYIISCASVKLFLWLNTIQVSFVILALGTAFFNLLSLAGDLFESYLKRRAGIKDSGTLLPGHGGLLDRFDGALFVALVFYALQTYIHNLLFRI